MNLASQIFAALAVVFHILFFCMESLWFMRPQVFARFGAKSQTDAESQRLFAFNQGFYNLFLAMGCAAGIVMLQGTEWALVGRTLVLFTCACMLGAAAVLTYSAPQKMLRAAAIQGLPPLLAIGLYLALG
ncbi:MAG: DUF1304 domain-containing protein [Nevskiales bacterium]